MRHKISLSTLYPPSSPCSCVICTSYCSRPGWWTVKQARRAFASGYATRMMLEISPDSSMGVLSPAFRGCEGFYAIDECKGNGCNFLRDGHCELHGTDMQPMECRFVHHERQGQGQLCHDALERDWRSAKGQQLVADWLMMIGLASPFEILHQC